MVLSARSCGLEEPFTEDISEKCIYWVQRKPKEREKERNVEEIIKERTGIEGDKKRRKTEEVSREEELDRRVKKKGDKFAWF